MERQLGTTLEEIRYDHRARYCFAADVIPEGSKVLDAACGIGYGSKILDGAGNYVTGVDIDQAAIDAAYTHYNGPKYAICNLQRRPLILPGYFDAAVSFETLEHLQDPIYTLRKIADVLPRNGLLIASVPNEERYPFVAENFAQDQYPHLRHYTPAGFEELLSVGDFAVESRHCQIGKFSDVTDGTDGMFLVYVSRRR